MSDHIDRFADATDAFLGALARDAQSQSDWSPPPPIDHALACVGWSCERLKSAGILGALAQAETPTPNDADLDRTADAFVRASALLWAAVTNNAEITGEDASGPERLSRALAQSHQIWRLLHWRHAPRAAA